MLTSNRGTWRDRIRKTLLKPAACYWRLEMQIEANYSAALARQENPIWYRGMLIRISPPDQIKEAHEVPQATIFNARQ